MSKRVESVFSSRTRVAKTFAVCAAAFAAAFSAFATDLGKTGINVYWGISSNRIGQNYWNNGTRLYGSDDPDAPFSYLDFRNRYKARLMFVGDGGWDDERGFSTAVWLDSFSNAYGYTAAYYKESSTGLQWSDFPATTTLDAGKFWDWDGLPDDRKAGATELEWYWNRWNESRVCCVAEDVATGKYYRFSPDPGGTAIAGLSAVRIMCLKELSASKRTTNYVISADGAGYSTGVGGHDLVNVAPCGISTESRRVYLGAELPARCTWMADFGLSPEELAGYPAGLVDEAVAARCRPEDILPAWLSRTMILLR